MVDIPASSSTTAGIAVGGTVTGSLEVVGYHDWFKITLAAGQSVTITLTRGSSIYCESRSLMSWDSIAGVFPTAAFKFLIAIGRLMVDRLRKSNQRYIDSMLFPLAGKD